ncbi:MAG: hypothetical protein AAGA23_01355 [Pseudomonadota bacterium]
MRQVYYQFPQKPRGTVATVLSALVGLGVLGLMLFFGLIVGAVLAAVGLLVAIYFRVRLWWLKRQGQLPGERPNAARRRPGGDVIEGEYEVVDRRDRR